MRNYRKSLGESPSPLADVSTEVILESISDGVFTVDDTWRITSFNRAAEQITGIPRQEAIGQRCSDVFRASMCETDCALRRTIQTGTPLVNKTAFIIDANGRRIPISVSTALLRDRNEKVVGGAETFRDLTTIEELRKELHGRFELGDIVSRSASMRRVLDILPRIAESDSSVLIQGETGTGKEVFAKAIHELSKRREGPFVAVNCGALPDSLLESELFGYKSGAFTGAHKDKPGRFAMADGGTLFLDEIGEVSQALQVRLLRVLQEKSYEPLGGTRTQNANVRVITATNRDLDAMVSSGAFRQDLYYRTKVIKIDLPPLRQRREDIPLLVERFVTQFNAAQGKKLVGPSPDVLSLLMAHEYPGNLRQLRNIIEYAFVVCLDGQIELQHLPPDLLPSLPSPVQDRTMEQVVQGTERNALLMALDRNDGNRLATANELGMHKSTLFRKARALGIELPVTDGRSKRKKTKQQS